MASPNEVLYSPKAGRYIWADSKKFVPDAVIRNFVAEEQAALKVRMQAHTRLMIQGSITLADWQTRMGESLRDAHLRMGMLGAGGKDRLDSRGYGAIGFQLRRQYEYLDGFARSLFEGKLTPNQALSRAARYAASVTPTFNRTQQITRENEGFDEAKRMLDSQAQHCRSCLSYSTRGEWKAIAEVVPPGVNCECGQFCRCQIAYRRRTTRMVNLSQVVGGILST